MILAPNLQVREYLSDGAGMVPLLPSSILACSFHRCLDLGGAAISEPATVVFAEVSRNFPISLEFANVADCEAGA